MTSTLSIKTEKKIYKYLKKKKKVVGWICMSEDAYQEMCKLNYWCHRLFFELDCTEKYEWMSYSEKNFFCSKVILRYRKDFFKNFEYFTYPYRMDQLMNTIENNWKVNLYLIN